MESNKKNIIMGIDPGTRITGYGIIDASSSEIKPIDFGCIKPPPKYPLSKRYLIIYNSIEELIKKYSPSSIAVETQFVKKNVQSALKLGMARGVVIIASEKNNVPVFEYAPRKAKQAVVGNGSASKTQVQKMIQTLLCLPELPQPEDASDGLALAICHAHAEKMNMIIGNKNV
jgi:crossover junction endodeoxyribonuclease RuvC